MFIHVQRDMAEISVIFYWSLVFQYLFASINRPEDVTVTDQSKNSENRGISLAADTQSAVSELVCTPCVARKTSLDTTVSTGTREQ